MIVFSKTGLYVINMFGLLVTVGITFACSVIAAGKLLTFTLDLTLTLGIR
jgi:hypothetical protein